MARLKLLVDMNENDALLADENVTPPIEYRAFTSDSHSAV